MYNALKYFLLVPAGLLLILFCSLLQHENAATPGEYYYSSFLQNNYTLLTGIVFLLAGFAAGYYFKLNSWVAGICFIFIFPLTSLYEGTVYKGSHNLLPFEFIIHFLFALPSLMGVYMGNFVSKLDNIGYEKQILSN